MSTHSDLKRRARVLLSRVWDHPLHSNKMICKITCDACPEGTAKASHEQLQSLINACEAYLVKLSKGKIPKERFFDSIKRACMLVDVAKAIHRINLGIGNSVGNQGYVDAVSEMKISGYVKQISHVTDAELAWMYNYYRKAG